MPQRPFFIIFHILCWIRNIFVKDCQGALTRLSGHAMLVLTNQYLMEHYIPCFTLLPRCRSLRQKG